MRANLVGLVLIPAVLAGMLVVAPSAAADTGPLLNPDNGHFYESVSAPGGINWSDAKAAAEAREYRSASGHLVTITSAQEDAFVVANFPEAFPVVSLPRTPACNVPPPLIGENSCAEPWWMGGFQGADGVEPGGGWEWVTGEPFTYANWAAGEPNQFSGVEEDCLAPHPEGGSPMWNDAHCDDEKAGGYLVEYEPTPRACPTESSPFTDVSDTSFANKDIDCIYGLKITTGTSPTTYSPADNVTREQMAAFLARIWRELGLVCPSEASPFTDVSDTSFANKDIDCIYGLKITTGTSPTTYSPAANVTREQMAAFLARIWREQGNVCPTLESPFTDVSDTSFANKDIDCIYGLKITTGTSPTTYSPADNVTREQMAAFLARIWRAS